jgi:hypothetical protein
MKWGALTWRRCASQGADQSVSIQFPPSPHLKPFFSGGLFFFLVGAVLKSIPSVPLGQCH